MKRALLIGSNGQVGTEVARLWQDAPVDGAELIGLTHADFEIADRTSVHEAICRYEPDVIINTAGFLRVDECESAPDTALAVNALGVKYLAEAAAQCGSFVIQFSTDYVFDGNNAQPYCETDVTTPLNAYGLSKLTGEQFLRYSLPDSHLIVRTSGVFGPAGSTNKGGNFVETMLRLANAGRDLRVVNDQVFSPTYAPDLARATLQLIALKARGVVHVSSSGSTTWHDFAAAAFSVAGLKPSLSPVSSQEYGAAAIRPRYSVLDNRRSVSLGVTPLRTWQDALTAYMDARTGP